MKLFKYALVLFMSVSMVSCGSDDDSSTNSRELTNENIMGSYNITSFENEADSSIAGTTIQSSESVGSTFGTSMIDFNSDGTFDLSGQFLVSVVSGGLITGEDSFIVNLDDTAGTYSLNDSEDTIFLDFDGLIGDDQINLDGTYDVDSFSEELLVISLEGSITEPSVLGEVTNEVMTTLRFERN